VAPPRATRSVLPSRCENSAVAVRDKTRISALILAACIIYSLSNGTANISTALDNTDDGEESGGLSISAIAMIEKSSILALVGNGANFSRNKVVIWDHARNLTLATLTFPAPVLNVLLHYY